MLQLFCKLMFYEGVLAFKRLVQLILYWRLPLPPALVALRCALRFDSLATRLFRMQKKIIAFEGRICAGCYPGLIDEDNSLTEMMQGLKQDVRMVRLELASLHGVNRNTFMGAHLGKALDRLHAVAESTYAAADRLQWEIGQHDGRYRAAKQAMSGG